MFIIKLVAIELNIKQVNYRITDKVGNKLIGWIKVKVLPLIGLLNDPIIK